MINTIDFKYADWRSIDVLVLPDGFYKFLSDKDAAADLKTWVRQGGKIIALESATSQMVSSDWGKTEKGRR